MSIEEELEKFFNREIPLSERIFDYLWDKRTTEHITSIVGNSNRGPQGGHTVQSIMDYYNLSKKTSGLNNDKSISICQTEETTIPGYYRYYLLVQDRKFDKRGRYTFLPTIRSKDVFDLDVISINDFYETAKKGLVGAYIFKSGYRGHSIEGKAEEDIEIYGVIDGNNGWHFKTVYPKVKTKELEKEKNM